ncbi:peptidylprolyl isomerase [Aquibaculum arenosum]|uniref:Parvulin-like PPIase n=1 Tax=Aquibaculum arenosum TaxID=3032591 RepID=A0ABT5YMM2_9PROT|nr:peptidylprolyl isomerase [Fodinicurvata sp. CAU 1616]MDF2096201.1 peptidylprolyl isomerase [Fodinicurvata sp. CAU 1616]
MRILVLTLLIALVWPLSGPRQSAAQDVFTAAAVVNDEVISRLDFEGRIRVALLASGLPENEETLNQIAGPVLRQLIDEQLQRQEAERLSISVSEEEVDQALEQMAQRNEMTPEQFVNMLEGNGAPLQSIHDQLRASVAWNKILSAQVVPDVQVTEEEIDQAVDRMSGQDAEVQARFAEIFIPFQGTAEENEARQLSERLIDQLAQGASFQQLAAQFSQAPTAAAGGDRGFVSQSRLAPDIASVIADMQPGDLAGPIPSVNGYYILVLIDRRQGSMGGSGGGEGRVRLTQIAWEAEPGQEDAVMRQAEEATVSIDSCAAAEDLAAEIGGAGSGDMGFINTQDMSDELRSLALNLPQGVPSPPIFTGESVMVLFVCDREIEGGNFDRDAVAESLRRERLDMLSARYMRDLRRAANIDVRL